MRYPLFFVDCHLSFWRKHPCLFIGLIFLLGTASAVAWSWIYLLALLCLLFPFLLQRCLLFCTILLILLAFFSARYRTHPLDLAQSPLEGKGIFHINHFSILHSPFNKSYHYKGVLKSFQTKEGTLYHNLPCSIFHSLKNPPIASNDYLIEGFLTQKKPNLFCLKPKKQKKWTAIDHTFSLAAWRYNAKKNISSYIKAHISDSASAQFLSALVTGEIEERTLRMDFSRLGLQHILAISGFHFSFFACVLHLLLRPFFPFKIRITLLIAALACYFFFLGNAPSILRAFTALCIFMCAPLIKRRAIGLNALGAALILEICLDPLIITQLSFQLSFLCTLALLLFVSPMHYLCCYLLPERSMSQLSQMSLFDKHGYLISTLIRKSLSINCAVHLFSLPVLLHLFHKFPLLSLFYNLFFPIGVSVSLVLLCCSCLTAFLFPPLSSTFHDLNDVWTSSLLQLTFNPPAYFDVIFRCNIISFPAVIISLLFLFHIGILFAERKKFN